MVERTLIQMTRPVLIMMVGLSASGKSSVAEQLAKNYNAKIVSSDSIREEICGDVSDQSRNEKVFVEYHKRIKKLLEANENVIVDATNITIKSRKNTIEQCRKYVSEIICYVIPKRFEDCVKDNFLRKSSVPIEVLLKQIKTFEIPFYEEGFSHIIVHNLEYRDRKTLFELYDCMNKEQMNPHHTMTVQGHCSAVLNYIFQNYSPLDMDVLTMGQAAMVHDIGKIWTQSFDKNNVAHYFQHHNVGAYYLLTNLFMYEEKENNDTLLEICFLVNYHMLPFFWEKEKTYKKYKNIFGEKKYRMLLAFNEADKCGR